MRIIEQNIQEIVQNRFPDVQLFMTLCIARLERIVKTVVPDEFSAIISGRISRAIILGGRCGRQET